MNADALTEKAIVFQSITSLANVVLNSRHPTPLRRDRVLQDRPTDHSVLRGGEA
jgi:hypothetical protein